MSAPTVLLVLSVFGGLSAVICLVALIVLWTYLLLRSAGQFLAFSERDPLVQKFAAVLRNVCLFSMGYAIAFLIIARLVAS
jgi:hypothetical protein